MLLLRIRASECLHVMQYNAVNFKVKLYLNVFNATGWAKKRVCLIIFDLLGEFFSKLFCPSFNLR